MTIWQLLRIKTVVEMENIPSEQAFEDACNDCAAAIREMAKEMK